MEVFSGLVARPVDEGHKKYIKIWLCPKCRKDAKTKVAEEDINILEWYFAGDNEAEME
jgi:hypothetical protein